MTGSTSPGLDSLVLQWNMGRREKALAMLESNQALVDQLKQEIARLETPGTRDLLKTDTLSQQLHRVLKAIQSATTSAADLLGHSDILGDIKPGKFADVIAVNGDPLQDISVLEHVQFVMKDGKVYKQ